jgi:hippurate hydrolase
MRSLLLGAASLGLILTAHSLLAEDNLHSSPIPAATREKVQSLVNQAYPSLEALYLDLHRSPELSLHEEKTSRRVANELESAGLKVTRNFGGFGVVGVLANGPGPTVLVRTDLDGLPVKEETGVPYASQVVTKNDKGETVSVMHACGHDIHMSVFVGTARVLNQLKDQWHGTVVLIGQPAEEKVAGAKAMLEEGLFNKFPKPDYCLALHCSATMEAGTVGYVPGAALGNVDSVDVVVHGVGGHGAYPHTTKDPIVLASEIVLALQTIVSRETPPIEPAVVTVGSIHGGTKHNIIPNEVKLQLTVRSYSQEVHEHILASIRRITRGLAEAAGIPEPLWPTVTILDESCPATVNDPALTMRLAGVFKNWIGPNHVFQQNPVMAAEDFSQFGRTPEKVPICLYWLGVVEPELYKEHATSRKSLPSLHSSQFRPLPEPSIKTGVTTMTAAVMDLLGSQNQ